jgi:hypothetical protein
MYHHPVVERRIGRDDNRAGPDLAMFGRDSLHVFLALNLDRACGAMDGATAFDDRTS